MVKERSKPFTIRIPEEKITPEEIERRRKLVDKILKLREKVGPISISTTELIRQVRGDWEPGE